MAYIQLKTVISILWLFCIWYSQEFWSEEIIRYAEEGKQMGILAKAFTIRVKKSNCLVILHLSLEGRIGRSDFQTRMVTEATKWMQK